MFFDHIGFPIAILIAVLIAIVKRLSVIVARSRKELETLTPDESNVQRMLREMIRQAPQGKANAPTAISIAPVAPARPEPVEGPVSPRRELRPAPRVAAAAKPPTPRPEPVEGPPVRRATPVPAGTSRMRRQTSGRPAQAVVKAPARQRPRPIRLNRRSLGLLLMLSEIYQPPVGMRQEGPWR
jgi:hypothetical protein